MLPEVLIPDLPAWMKKRSNIAGDWIDASQIRSLVQVTVVAGERKIRLDTHFTVLTWYDVLDVKAKEWVVNLPEMTVFTTAAGTLTHEATKIAVHRDLGCHAIGVPERRARALV